MAVLLLAAMLTPMLPEVRAEGDVASTYVDEHQYQTWTAESTGDLDIAGSGQTSITGQNQTISVDSANTQIIVNGDYYKETEQFNPRVAEVWSGNRLPNNTKALWVPKWSELPTWFTSNLMANEGYAALYTGFMEYDDTYGYKPYGVTRVGETLGYDVYAAHGEDYANSLNDSAVQDASSIYNLLSPSSEVTRDWAVINLYRALGIEHYQLAVTPLSKVEHADVISKILPDNKITNGLWDINRSPVVQFLSGNIASGYTGDSEPVLIVWASRSYSQDYVQQAKVDRLEYDYSDATASDTISCAEFCRWVAFLMEAYGEPVITEQEQYMLLEAYGRKLPYDLFPAELEAVKYLMVRGIIDGPDELALLSGGGDGWDWVDPITFEQATTILMRVKDKGSRLTFKEFQLTTDLNLLKQGFYPTEVALAADNYGYSVVPTGYLSATETTHYDYFVRREDNRALFLSEDEEAIKGDGTGSKVETAPHVSAKSGEPYSRLPNSFYRGRTDDGWYWFQIPIDSAHPTYYINSAHSDKDSPAQYALPYGGGYYVMGNGAGSGDKVGCVQHATFASNGTAGRYVDAHEFKQATSSADHQTANDTDLRNRVTQYTLSISSAILDKADGWTWKASSWNHDEFIWPPYPGTTGVDMDKVEEKDNVIYVKSMEDAPSAEGGDGYVKCKVYRSRNMSQNDEYYTFIVCAEQPISKAMAQSACNFRDNKLVAGLVRDGDGSGSPARTIKAYCKSGSEYLVSVEYLKMQGAITSFVDFGHGKYYMSVDRGSHSELYGRAPDTDVYLDCGRDGGKLVIFGNTAYIYNESDIVVNHANDDYYVMLSAVNGLTDNVAIQIPGESEVLMPRPVNSFAAEALHMGQVHDYKQSIEYLDYEVDGVGRKAAYIDMSETHVNPNFIAVVDRRHGDGVPCVFTLYEYGKKIDGYNATNRNKFADYFGFYLGDESMVYKMQSATPEGVDLDDGVLGTDKPPDILYTSTGQVLVRLIADEVLDNSTTPNVGLDTYWVDPKQLPLMPYHVVEQVSGDTVEGGRDCVQSTRHLYSILTNRTADGESVLVDWLDHAKVLCYQPRSDIYITSTTSDWKKFSGKVKLQPCGLPALIADFTVEAANVSQTFAEYIGRSTQVKMWLGSDAASKIVPARSIPFKGRCYVTKFTPYVIHMQLYNGNLISSDILPSTLPGAELRGGGVSKWYDWVSWLKQAKLEYAEDIITICILAVLQWLPRVFMFIFFLLMGLSMIASVKPWVIFCDRYFDPYKLLTAGRMDVHTVDLKKVMLCSMIALILFGFFQNGLILDIIAWCARAVTGILNR